MVLLPHHAPDVFDRTILKWCFLDAIYDTACFVIFCYSARPPEIFPPVTWLLGPVRYLAGPADVWPTSCACSGVFCLGVQTRTACARYGFRWFGVFSLPFLRRDMLSPHFPDLSTWSSHGGAELSSCNLFLRAMFVQIWFLILIWFISTVVPSGPPRTYLCIAIASTPFSGPIHPSPHLPPSGLGRVGRETVVKMISAAFVPPFPWPHVQFWVPKAGRFLSETSAYTLRPRNLVPRVFSRY